MRVLSIMAIAILLFLSQAHATNPEMDWDDCLITPYPDKKISSCTEVINRRKRETKLNRAIAYALRGWAYREKGNILRGKKDQRKAKKLYSKIALHFSQKADGFVKEWRYEEAIHNYSVALQLAPKATVLYEKRGALFERRALYDQALEDLNTAIKLNPKLAAALFHRGVILSFRERWKEAIEDFTRSISLDRTNANAFAHRGFAYRERGDNKGAKRDFKTALKRDPELPESYFLRGEERYKNSDYERAIYNYSLAIAINPNDDGAYYSRGLAFSQKGLYGKAIADYGTAIQLNPKNEDTYIRRGTAYRKKGLYDSAIEDYNEALRLVPTNKDTYIRRGSAYRKKGLYDRAIADYDKAIQLDPRDVEAYTDRGTAYRKKGLYDRAIEDYSKAIRLDHEYVEAYTNRGTAYRQKGFYDHAIADFDKALLRKPTNAKAYFKRGNAYSHKGLYDRAIEDYDKALRLNQKYASAYNNRGIAYRKKGLYDRAVDDFEKALQIDPLHKLAKNNLERAAKRFSGHAPLSVLDGALFGDIPSSSGDSFVNRFPDLAAKKQIGPLAKLYSDSISVPARAKTHPSANEKLGPRVTGRRVALLIGNSKYKHQIPLLNPAQDVKDIAKALRDIGFDKVIIEYDQNLQDMSRVIHRFAAQASNADIAVVYYAGHGMELGGATFLIPVDAKLKIARDLEFEAVKRDLLELAVEGASKLRLILLDSCRDNPVSRRMVLLGSLTRSLDRGLARIAPGTADTLVFYAAEHGATAEDGPSRNSPFATALLKHLSDPHLEVGLLLRRVRASVIAATNEKQKPVWYGSLPEHTVYLNAKAK